MRSSDTPVSQTVFVLVTFVWLFCRLACLVYLWCIRNGAKLRFAYVRHSNLLRKRCSRSLYQRWREQEMRNAADAGFSLDAKQLEEEWHTLVRIAAQPGQPLEQLHIFVLAHILRRPIIVYGVKMVKSFRGEEISPAKWVRSFLITSVSWLKRNTTKRKMICTISMLSFFQRSFSI